jgi:ceramide glucosyltransferase
MIFLTFSMVLACIGLLLTSAAPWHVIAWGLFCVTALARLGLHIVPRLPSGRPLLEDLFLVPVRDLLICWLWAQSFFSRRITWRGSKFDVDATGVMRRIA